MIQTYADLVKAYLELNVDLAPLISVILRTAAIVIAQIPGTPIDLINLAFFNKMTGFILAEISVMLGSSINFYIARKFGEPVVSKFIDISKIHIWEERINKASGFWGMVLIRMGTIVICDYISYVSGLTRTSFARFFSTSLIASLPLVGAFYYFGGILVEKEFVIVISLIVPLMFLYSLLKRGKIFKRFQEYINIKVSIEKLNNLLNGERKDKKIMRE